MKRDRSEYTAKRYALRKQWRLENPDLAKIENERLRDSARERIARWRLRNPEKAKASYARANSGEKAQARRSRYHAKNADKRNDQNSRYRKENPHVFAAKSMKRHAAKLRATPIWADHAKILEFYAEAARLTLETGIRHEVDHIYPLQGKFVCGLHVENNLQIITKIENIRKSNKLMESDLCPAQR